MSNNTDVEKFRFTLSVAPLSLLSRLEALVQKSWNHRHQWVMCLPACLQVEEVEIAQVGHNLMVAG